MRSQLYSELFPRERTRKILGGFNGLGIGAALSFMMAVTALSLPSIIMLKKVVKTRLLMVFVGIVTAGILIIGYSFNAFCHLFL